MDKTHSLFLQRLDGSRGAVWKVAEWLSRNGKAVQIQPPVRAPERRLWREYTDQGDITVVSSCRVEVKKLTRDFTGLVDWPFGEKFIVCSKHDFERARPKPVVYYVMNRSETVVAEVLVSTKDRWHVEERRDSWYAGVEDIVREFYLAPLDCVRFIKIA